MERDTAVEYATEDHEVVLSNQSNKKRNCRWAACGVFLGLLLLAGIIILILLLLFVGQQPPKVTTSYGIVEGMFDMDTGTFSFKGIPFAAPPVEKSMRFAPPQRLCPENTTCWSGSKQFTEYPAECIQWDSESETARGSEDCLYLNVFSPDVDPDELYPVMVYIHGGYLQVGNSSWKGYCPDENTAKLLNVVIVSIQYRLNAFGFLVVEPLDNQVGNYGYLDQIAALEWIQENIRGFGGDPKRVTLLGQSSGGTSILALMGSPKTANLFHQAWSLSGSPIFNKTIQDAAKQNAPFLEELECETLECLQSKPAIEIARAADKFWGWVFQDSMDLPIKDLFEPALPVIDGENGTFPLPLFEMWEKRPEECPQLDNVIIGVTSQEIDQKPAPYKAIKSWTMEDLEAYVSERLDPFGGNITNASLSLYLDADKDPEYVFTTMAADIRVTCGNDILANYAAGNLKANVYRYIATYQPSSPCNAFESGFWAKYAFHGIDHYAFLDTLYFVMEDRTNSADERFGDILRDNIMSFVHNKKPKNADWKPWPNNTALFGEEITVTEAYHEEECNFWKDNDFFSYAWIN